MKEILRLHLLNRVVSGSAAGKVRRQKADSDARRRAVLEKHGDIHAAIQRSDSGGGETRDGISLQELIDHNFRLMSRTENGIIARELTPEELAYSS